MSSCTCAVSRLHVLSYLHDALPISPTLASAIVAPLMTVFFPMENNAAGAGMGTSGFVGQIMAIETMGIDRKSTRLNSSHVAISYAVFWLKQGMRCTGDTHIVAGLFK